MNLSEPLATHPVLPLTIIVQDIGRSAVKAKARCRGNCVELIYPSIVTRASKLVDDEMQAALENESVTYRGNTYFTGEAARLYGGADSTVGLTNDWVNSVEYAVLVLSTIKRFRALGVEGTENAYVVVGTPADLYSSDKKSLESITNAILPGNEVKALSQPLGVYFSHILNSQGKAIVSTQRDATGRKKSWTIIEVGEFDTGFTLIKEGAHQQERDDISEGISEAVIKLQRDLRAKKIRLDLLECSEALRTGKIKRSREYVAITEDIVNAVAPTTAKIIDKARKVFRNDIEKVAMQIMR